MGDVSLDVHSAAQDELLEVPDFVGMQALNAWLAGHDCGLLLVGPDPDSPHPLLNGIIVRQHPGSRSRLRRWDVVTVWVDNDPGDFGGVREPRRPPPPVRRAAAERDVPAAPDRAASALS